MACSALFITIIFSLSTFFLQLVLAQVPSTTPTCASMLLSLVPCGPFVQGFAQLPTQPCCDGLNQIYSQEPTCLCLFLNNTSTLSPAFPINQTLALQLPPLCNIPANSSSCSSSSASSGGEAPSASSSVAPPPSASAGTPVSRGAKNNTSVATTPVAQVQPKPTSFMGLGYGLRSSGSKSKIPLAILVIAAILPGTLFLI